MEKKKISFLDFIWKDKKHRAKNFYFILTAFAVILALVMGFINSKFRLMQTKEDEKNNTNISQQVTRDEKQEQEHFQIMNAINSAGSFNDFLYQWANNGGEIYKNDSVINLLLCGLDSDDALENGGRSDSMILVSLNKQTQKINMLSFFRDSWCYTNSGGMNTYDKLNSSYYYGGPTGLIDTIEKNFKIDIDYYVAVDFSSFEDIINALGGIYVEVQQYEADYINATTLFNIVPGEQVHLNGIEALCFARIRKSDSDSDVSRTRRQRMVITSLINSVKGASISQLNDVMNLLFQYVKTDLTENQIMSYAMQALTNGWLNYEIVQHTFLSEDDVFCTGYVGSSSVVIVDFPLAAQKVQKAIYGDTNIVVDENRIRAFDLVDELDEKR
ncbi:MAG: LCP family protein [Acutalibacteraceae bacterium]